MTLLWMSFSGGLLILLVWALRRPLLARLPAGILPVLWGVVLLRLLLPLSLPVLPDFRAVPEVSSEDILVLDGPALFDGTAEPVGPNDSVPVNPAPPAPSLSDWAPGLALGVWLAGVLGMAGSFLLSYLRSRREFRRSGEIPSGEAKEALDALLTAWPLRRRVSMRCWEAGDAPLTYGLLRPVILLPVRACWQDRRELSLMLAHELVHIRRMDVLFKLLAVVALCIHWFNPLVWQFVRLLGKDLELSCDETVMRRFGRETRGGYARTLLRLEGQKSGLAFGFGGMGKSTLEERIEMLMKMKNTTMAAVLAGALTIAGVTAAYALTTLEPKKETPPDFASSFSGGTTQRAAETENDPLIGTAAAEPSEEELEELYGPYGISFENSHMYFQGERVRYFLDGVELPEGGGVISHYEYFSDAGTVDVQTLRETTDNGDGSVNLFGPLTGIRRCTDEEFDRHTPHLQFMLDERITEAVATDSIYTTEETQFYYLDHEHSTENHRMYIRHGDLEQGYVVAPSTESTFAEGTVLTGATIADRMAVYGPYGVAYKDGNVYYNGKLVHGFCDMAPDGSVFSCYSLSHDGNGIVCAYYDHNGVVTGVQFFDDDDPFLLEGVTGPLRDPLEQASMDASVAQWAETLAPYLPYGLSYEYDPEAGLNGCGLHMWYDGKEIRSIWDETRGVWISEHQHSSTTHGTNDLCAVYENGHLCGLRFATDSAPVTTGTTHHAESHHSSHHH